MLKTPNIAINLLFCGETKIVLDLTMESRVGKLQIARLLEELYSRLYQNKLCFYHWGGFNVAIMI